MPEFEPTPSVEVDAVPALMAAGAQLLDVREQYEWDAGHAPDARLIPMSEFQERASTLSQDIQWLVICQSGVRSDRVTQYLRLEGYDAVNVAGGMNAWQAAGFDVVPARA